jgi:hypothetical protein
MGLEDTSAKAQAVYWERLAEMTPAEKVAIGVALWQAADSVQRAALRQLYPQADEDEITFRLAVTRFGPELARKIYGRE